MGERGRKVVCPEGWLSAARSLTDFNSYIHIAYCFFPIRVHYHVCGMGESGGRGGGARKAAQ